MVRFLAEQRSGTVSIDASRQDFFGHPAFMKFATAILSEERTRLEVSALVKWLRLGAGVDVLDFGCGYGRLAVPLARHGCHVVGLDGSHPLLERARAAAAEAAVKIDFLHQDMCVPVATAGRFDVVINMSTAFGYDDDPAGDLAALSNVRDALRPGGRFLIDTENREAKIRTAPVAEFSMAGVRVSCERAFDPLTGRWRETMTWRDGGTVDRSVFEVRLYSATELVTMLEAVGLELVRAWGWFDGSAYDLDSRRMILLARRPD